MTGWMISRRSAVALLTGLCVGALLLSLAACSGQRHLVLVGSNVEPPPPAARKDASPEAQKPAPAKAPLYEPPHYDRVPTVRVWLSSLPAEPLVQVTGYCHLIARDGATHRVPHLGPVRPRLVPGGFKLGNEFFKSSGVDIEPDAKDILRVENTPFPGTVRLIRNGDAITVINILNVETYLRGVLGSEMPPSWPQEALKAQAVAARTYVLFFCRDRAAFEWDVTSTVEDQMYSGGMVQPSVAEAVRQTTGQTLLHKNCLFPAFYHSTCGGSTEPPSRALGRPEYDFIEGTACKYCIKSRHFSWTDRLSAAELAARFKKGGVKFTPPVREIIPTESADDGERAVKIVHAGGDVTLSMIDFRRIAGRNIIRSGRFECRRDGADFVFTGHGSGHGAGLCQYGAKGLADAGKSYKDILDFYYHNASIGKLY